ncbi:MAG: YdcF family protein [Kovacikia sp.]
MEALLLLTSIGILWLISSRWWRRRLLNPLAIFLLVYLVGTSPAGIWLATWGLTVSLPPDSGKTADAIVVLGRGAALENSRVETVNQLWQAGRASRVFASGMMDAPSIIDRLKEHGIPGQLLSGERCSQSTEENAQFTAAELRPQKVQKILLVTDLPHMRRSVLSFDSFGFTVLPYPSPLPAQMGFQDQLISIAREYLGLAKYSFTGRFRQRSSAELDHPSREVLEKLSTWNCRLQGA